MLKSVLASITASLLLFAPSHEASACGDKGEKNETIASVTVEKLDSMLQSNTATVFDANGKDTRAKEGVIKGARLLTGYRTFKASELPKDKNSTLVFYCYNDHCGASKKAAKRARSMGYRDSRTLPSGIVGWKKAGKPLASAGQS